MTRRDTQLIPPDKVINTSDSSRLQDILSLLQATYPHNFSDTVARQLLHAEAEASSAIESEYDPSKILLHQKGLIAFLQKPLTEATLLELHQQLLHGQPHAQPGQYRTVNVIVGQHRPPPHEHLQNLMANFFHHLQEADQPVIAKAAWAHMAFEIIHPFADGNGRTGRALINHILGSPVPISRFILANRREYYRLLALTSWNDFVNWLAIGLSLETQAQQQAIQDTA